jgi:nanoRNase/pAp phosphatase (c-di-AMP/oligoRNAs hydrolase)
MKKYGGGGHKGVGGLERKSKKEIMKIAEEIIEYLNKHG